MPDKPLTKAQQKAQRFRKKQEEEFVPREGKTEPVTAKEPKKQEGELKRKRNVKEKHRGSPRFILFAGNLPYNASSEELKKFFEKASPSVIRMRKGYAFLEFEGSNASANLNAALRFHHSTFNGRKINVELTAGGGGNSEKRKSKVAEKNRALAKELAARVQWEKEMQAQTQTQITKQGPSHSAKRARHN